MVISSDKEEEQDKTSPTSPPDLEKGHPGVYEYQPKSPVYPPPSDSSEEEDFSSIPDPRPNKDHNPRAFGLISGPCTYPSSRQQKLNKVRKEEASPNLRKRAREATPFNPHDAPSVISSDKEEEQDKTSPTSPPDHEQGHPGVYEYQPKSPVYPPPSDSSEEEDFSSIPDLVTPAEEMSPAPDHLNDSSYETQGTIPADVNADQDSFQGKDKQETLAQALEDDLSKAP